jgi:hypothetical protein
MHNKYYPACPVDGPIEPAVPFAHMISRGAVPNKCSSCQFLFEGECRRMPDRYLHLDHGPCGVDGPTDPVFYENEFVMAKVSVPRKCTTCRFLNIDSIDGFHCGKDSEIWGDFHRGLDWGAWSPDRIYLELPAPKITTRVLSECAHQNDLIGFIKEHRRVNPGFSLEEAKTDFAFFRDKIDSE